MRTFVIGDIHGELDKLKKALERVDFDYENDRLVSIGDVVDRGLYSYECVEELLKIKNLIAIRGNHDAAFKDAIVANDLTANLLYTQGGRETRQSYYRNCHERDNGDIVVPDSHIDFYIVTQKNYWIDENNNLFVHGGFNRHNAIDEQVGENVYYWDRDLFMAALSWQAMVDKTYAFKMKTNFNKIFIGHTPTTYFDTDKPIKAANIWNVDTGCGKGDNYLTIMNVDTEEYWQVK